ncbi:hypothetical protein [Chelatococcus sp.]|uniref:hypothetical protein n=1 Tax=Chelatococcus sp. TaxID=1953771 RepID=UPI001ED70DBF|nr:hypothetical protein [Chelatococcus sp.]MBX3545611.1 hypothetical protein [Chelatococcus sp.]
MVETGDDGGRHSTPLAELTSAASLEALNATLALRQIDALRIVSIVLEPAFFDPVGRLVEARHSFLQ